MLKQDERAIVVGRLASLKREILKGLTDDPDSFLSSNKIRVPPDLKKFLDETLNGNGSTKGFSL